MDYKLELVLVPVADVDRAKAFYTDQAGFVCDVDHRAGDDFRVVQLTPPGSACSIRVGVGITDAEPGSVTGMHLVVTDIVAARDELTGRGVKVSDVHGRGCCGKPARTLSALTTAPSPTSATPTATPGCCRRPAAASPPRDLHRGCN